MRHRVVKLIVDRGWPFMIGVYAVLAAVSLARDNDAPFHLYTYTGRGFGIAVFSLTALACAATTIVPRVAFHRWAFFIIAGFTLTGRILQHQDSENYGVASLARGAFTVAALLAHFVIQVDWAIEREHEAGRDG